MNKTMNFNSNDKKRICIFCLLIFLVLLNLNVIAQNLYASSLIVYDQNEDNSETQDYYVRAGAAGDGSGSDWNNAFTQFPDTLVRGAIYYVADGEYPEYAFDTAEDGEKYITIKKATPEEHGTNVGWNNNYGDGQAVFQPLLIKTGYWIIDGSSRESKNSGHGFKIVIPGDKSTVEHCIRVVGPLSSTRIDNITVEYVEFTSDIDEYPPGDKYLVKNGYEHTNGGSNVYIGYCYFHHFISSMQRTRKMTNFVVEHNYYEDNKNYPDGPHGDAIQLWGSDASATSFPSSNCVIRYNEFRDIEGTASVSFAWGVENIRVYGNVCYYSKDTEKTGAWVVYAFKGNVGSLYIYNNTIANYNYIPDGKGFGTIFIADSSALLDGSEQICYNNLWFNSHHVGTYGFENSGYHYIGQSTLSPVYQPEITTILSDNNPFVNLDEYDFHLAESTGPGKVLSSETWWDPTYDSDNDIEGNPRDAYNVWNVGAYQFVDSKPVITRQPEQHTLEVGQDLVFTIEAVGSDRQYQWQYEGENGFVDLEGKNDSRLIISDTKMTDEGYYRVIVSNDMGSVSSDEVFLNIVDKVPEINDLNCTAEFDTVYLSWVNPDEENNDWDKVLVVRKKDDTPSSPEDDGEEIYNGTGNYVVDRNLDNGEYHYAIYAYIETDNGIVYSEAVTAEVFISDLLYKNKLRIDPEEGRIKIGQSTRGDLYSLWNEEKITIGRGPTGNDTSLWIYSDIIGDGENQVSADSEIISARLVFSIKDSSFNDSVPIEGYDGNGSDQFNLIYEDSRSIEIYQITDPDGLGMPHYAKDSGIRAGLDYEYRDHRPGVNKPWVDDDIGNIDYGEHNESTEYSESNETTTEIDGNIEKSLAEQEPLDIIGFKTEVLSDELLDSIQLDITEAVQAWSDGEENQGLYITTGQNWNNGEILKLYGVSAEESEEQQEYGQSLRPYLEIVFVNSGSSSDITGPDPVQNLKTTQGQEPDTDSITLSWTNPEDIDFAGVKILRSEGIVPFNHMDGDFTVFVSNENETNESYTDSGLTPGQAYYYALYAYDNKHNYSEKAWIKGIPGSPAVPTFIGEPSISNGSVTLNWNTVTEAEGYRLYLKYDPGNIDPEDNSGNANPEASIGDFVAGYISGNVKCIEIKDVLADSYVDYLEQGTYTYWLTAVNEYGEGPESSKVVVEIGEGNKAADKPEAPTGFTEADVSESEQSEQGSKCAIKLSWTDNSNNESGFIIERRNDDGEWKEIFTTVYDVTEFIDRGLKPGTEYQYRIKAVNSAGESDYAECEVLTEGIADISWQVISASQVKVTWKAVQNATYKVELMDMEANVLAEQSPNTNYCYFVRLEPDTEYWVKITAIIGGEERYSTESDIIRTSADPKGGLF